MDKVRNDIKSAEHCLRTGQPGMAGLYLRRGIERLQDARKGGERR